MPTDPHGDDVVVIHRYHSADYDLLGDDTYLPANHRQVRDLLGKLLTQLDAMGLSERAHKAARTLIVETTWRWWGEVFENATTSAAGCIAPLVCTPTPKAYSGDPRELSNRWGWDSERAWLDSVRPRPVESAGVSHARTVA